MCGIAGFTGSDRKDVKDMCRAIYYRGPDDHGYLVDNYVSLGHRRLSIIDLSERGRQPLHNEDESVWITYNGEVYNYREVRRELEERGHRFYTDTDTEVIVHAYEEYGPGCVHRLRGMFAFAIWDADKKQLFLARDRLGIKPLYYYLDDNRLIFASEIKSILQHPEVDRGVNMEALRGFMVYGYTPRALTMFRGIFKLQPGNFLLYDVKTGKAETQEYWDVDFSRVNEGDEDFFVKSIVERLRDSVESHLVSDVPLGVFLSGGVDSSSIATLMSALTDAPIKTFTIGFEDKSYDESAYAKMVAESLGTEHYEKIISPEDTLRLIEEVTPLLDEPFGDVSMFPTYLVSQWARRKVKVVLDGDGGDELFAGYHWYKAQQLWSYYSPVPRAMRNLLFHVSNRMRVSESKKGVRTLIKKFVEGAALDPGLGHVRWRISCAERGLLPEGVGDAYGEVRELFQRAREWHPVNQMLYVDIKTSLPNDMLAKVDRMSMLNSLEVRVPFLDHVFVEFTTTIPPSMKLRNLETKYILKKAMSGILPREVLYRDKQGFSIPMKNWLKGELKPLMTELLSKESVGRRGYFSWDDVKKLMEQHIRGMRDNWHLLWRLMSLEIWHRNYLDSA